MYTSWIIAARTRWSRIRISDHKTEQVADLKNFAAAGRYGGALSLTPDDSPLLLRDTGTQDVYSVDWVVK